MADLYSVLLRLGLAQYFDKFSGEGFETWEIVLDITESDLWDFDVTLVPSYMAHVFLGMLWGSSLGTGV